MDVIVRLQEAGIAVLSDTTIRGRHCRRAAIASRRTTRGDPSTSRGLSGAPPALTAIRDAA